MLRLSLSLLISAGAFAFNPVIPSSHNSVASCSKGVSSLRMHLKSDQSSKAPTLASPLSLGELTLRNRVVMAPMTRARSNSEQLANADIKEYYAQRSSAGLIISEGVLISKQATGWMNAPGIYTDQMQESWKPVTDAVHKRGGLVFLQLWHMGRVSHSSLQENGQLPVAPSAIRIEGEEVYTPTGKQPYEVPRALETSEIPGVVQDYAKAAARARSAGFDGVELHGANGYLIDQFLQSKTNQRQDKYGGSIENRNRFLLEVVEAVTAEWPKGRVGVRLSPNSPYNGMGSPDFHEQFTSAIKALDRFDLAYVHVIDGLGFGFHQLGEPFTLDEARKASRHTIIGSTGYTKETADAAIASGKADLVSFGRPFISNPDLADRFLHGWPLAPEAPMSDWFTPQGAKGYTDFPAYKA